MMAAWLTGGAAGAFAPSSALHKAIARKRFTRACHRVERLGALWVAYVQSMS